MTKLGRRHPRLRRRLAWGGLLLLAAMVIDLATFGVPDGTAVGWGGSFEGSGVDYQDWEVRGWHGGVSELRLATTARPDVAARVWFTASDALRVPRDPTPRPWRNRSALSTLRALRDPALRLRRNRLDQENTDVSECRYMLHDLWDLGIWVEWPGLEGEHLTRVEVQTPRGYLFKELLAPWDTSPAGPAFVLWDGGPPQPVALQRQLGSRAKSVLAIGGTAISQYSMRGVWQFDVYLDNESTPRASGFCELL